MTPFSGEIKREINKEQEGVSDISKEKSGTSMQIHHRVPENALKGIGIRGNNCKENGVALNREDHLLADNMAIKNRLFWNGEAFVPLEEMPKETYRICACMPVKRENYHRKKEHRKHQRNGRGRR